MARMQTVRRALETVPFETLQQSSPSGQPLQDVALQEGLQQQTRDSVTQGAKRAF